MTTRSVTAWARTDPRSKLVFALAVVVVTVVILLASGADAARAGRVVGMLLLVPLAAVNGVVLRQRHRSLRWLVLYVVGLGLVPLLVALLGRPGQQA